jgi:hypothetical protein
MEKIGLQDELLDQLDISFHLIKKNTKPFRKILAYFSEKRVTTLKIASDEICNINLRTLSKTMQHLVEAGICSWVRLGDIHPNMRKDVARTKVYYMEYDIVPLFVERHYSNYIKERIVYEKVRCPNCGFTTEKKYNGYQCKPCLQKGIDSYFVPKVIR